MYMQVKPYQNFSQKKSRPTHCCAGRFEGFEPSLIHGEAVATWSDDIGNGLLCEPKRCKQVIPDHFSILRIFHPRTGYDIEHKRPYRNSCKQEQNRK